MRMIFQAENQECGLACLCMIADHFGFRMSALELRSKFGPSMKGMNLATLVQNAQKLGMLCRPVRLEQHDLIKLKTPCILHWNFDHFVVLAEVSGEKCVVYDPAFGRRVLDPAQISRSFTGVAVEIRPGASFQEQPAAARINWRSITGTVIGLKRALLGVFLISLAIEIIAVMMPQVTQWIVDSALMAGDRDLMKIALIGSLLLVAGDFAFRVARGWVSLRLNQEIAIQWTGNLLAHTLRLPIGFFERRSVGDIAARFTSLNAVRSFVTGSAVSACLDGLLGIITIVIMLAYSIVLGIIVIGALSLYILLRLAFYPALRMASEEKIIASANESSHFLETMRSAQAIKLFNMTNYRLTSWMNLHTEVQNRDIRTQQLMMIFSACSVAIFGIEGAIVLYLGGLQVLDGKITLGMLLAFIAYKSQFTQRASKIVDVVIDLKMLSLHKERIADIALQPPEPDFELPSPSTALSGSIEFIGVSFRYSDSEPWIFQNLDLKIEAGESVAVVGQSGCGKSTLLKLLTGLLVPNEGEIRIGGVPIRTLGLHALREKIGVVTQNDTLLSGSIAQNISRFNYDADQSQIEATARSTQMHFAILNMPMGYQTFVGEHGAGLSGGQLQRIMLARALYGRPVILALDEATSNLDLHNERYIVRAIEKLKITRFLIAHRPETINSASRIVEMRKGVLYEHTPPYRGLGFEND